VGAEVVGKPTVTVFHPFLGMSTPGLPSFFLRFPRGSFDRRAKNYFQQMSMGHRDLAVSKVTPAKQWQRN
jgi:hypothetical protein